jgi:hypothetical protein
MRLTLTFIALVSAAQLWAQVKCEAFIDWQYLQSIDVYATPDGEIVGQVRNDSVDEDFIGLEILDSRKNYLHVKATLLVSGKTQVGWIKQADYICAYYREERVPTMDLTLFETPSTKKPFVVKDWAPVLLTIEQCTGKWVHVSLRQNGHRVAGWIDANDLCANPYTTCN